MTTIDLSKIAEFIVKNGSKGVLLVWVAMQQFQINEIRKEYQDCMNNRIEDNRMILPFNKPLAIIPEKIKLEQWENKHQKDS